MCQEKKVSKEEKKIVRRKKRIFFIIVTLRRIFFPPFFLSHFLESTCSDKKKNMYKIYQNTDCKQTHSTYRLWNVCIGNFFSHLLSQIHPQLPHVSTSMCHKKKCAFLSPFFVNFFFFLPSSFSHSHFFSVVLFFSH